MTRTGPSHGPGHATTNSSPTRDRARQAADRWKRANVVGAGRVEDGRDRRHQMLGAHRTVPDARAVACGGTAARVPSLSRLDVLGAHARRELEQGRERRPAAPLRFAPAHRGSAPHVVPRSQRDAERPGEGGRQRRIRLPDVRHDRAATHVRHARAGRRGVPSTVERCGEDQAFSTGRLRLTSGGAGIGRPEHGLLIRAERDRMRAATPSGGRCSSVCGRRCCGAGDSIERHRSGTASADCGVQHIGRGRSVQVGLAVMSAAARRDRPVSERCVRASANSVNAPHAPPARRRESGEISTVWMIISPRTSANARSGGFCTPVLELGAALG